MGCSSNRELFSDLQYLETHGSTKIFLPKFLNEIDVAVNIVSCPYNYCGKKNGLFTSALRKDRINMALRKNRIIFEYEKNKFIVSFILSIFSISKLQWKMFYF